MFKAIVSDLDGTLLNAHHQLTPYTIRVLRAVAAGGVDLVLASGRPFADVEPLRRQIGLPMYLITSNGAQVHTPEGELLTQTSIAPMLVAELILAGRQASAHINVYRGDEWLVESDNPGLLKMHENSGFSYSKQDLLSLSHQGVIKVFFEGDPKLLGCLEQQLIHQFQGKLEIAFSLPNLLEVMAPGVNKAQALQQVLPRLQVNSAQAMAFGDGLNDLELLQSVGRGLLMKNAHPRLRGALHQHEVIGRHCCDAVACYLQKHLLRDDKGALPVNDPIAPHPCQLACQQQHCDEIRQQIQPLEEPRLIVSV